MVNNHRLIVFDIIIHNLGITNNFSSIYYGVGILQSSVINNSLYNEFEVKRSRGSRIFMWDYILCSLKMFNRGVKGERKKHQLCN